MRRFLFLTPALIAALTLAACTGGGGDVDASGLGDLAPMDQAAFAEGFNAARQIRADSTLPFDMDLFLEGFQHGLDGDTARLSYLYGFQIGGQMRQDTVLRLDRDQFLRGFRFGVDNDSLPLSEAATNRLRHVVQDTLAMRDLRRRARTDSSARARLTQGTRNAAENERFLTQLSQADSVHTTDSGLRYVVVTPGTGDAPDVDDVVLVHLVGHLRDGTALPIGGGGQAFPVQVGAFAVEGINEALLDMKPGERRRLYVPPALAFGLAGLPAQGEQPGVPPSSLLIFDVTLEQIIGAGASVMPEDMAPPGARPPTAPPQGR